MPRQHKAILGIDLDGVCADFYGYMREITAEWFEVDPATLTPDVSYGLREWGIQDDKQYMSLHRFAVTERQLFEAVPVVPGARRVLRKLSDENYRIRIITHRLYIQHFHGIAVKQTISWLDRHGIPYWDLCFMQEKEQVGADIYVEDGPPHIERLRKKGLQVICFANSTNTDVEEPRAENWDEVYELIKQTPHN